MIPKFLSRYARQASDPSSNDSQDNDDSSEYVTKIEVIGTSTVEIKKFSNFQTTSAYVLQQSKNNLQRIEISIDDLSKKTKGKFCRYFCNLIFGHVMRHQFYASHAL